METIEMYSEQKGWIVVQVERHYDHAFDAAKSLEHKLKDVPVRVVDDKTGETKYHSA